VVSTPLKNINVGTRLVGWYPIVAIFFLRIQFHDVCGGASIVASFFSFFSFFLGIFCVIHNFCFVQFVPMFEIIFELKKMLFIFFIFIFVFILFKFKLSNARFPNN
jgi:hypothetical protein